MSPILIALEDARICLDCDVVTDSEACPACDRRQTFPLALWLIPLQASQTGPGADGSRLETAAAMPSPGHRVPRALTRLPRVSRGRRASARWLIVVRGNEQQLYQFLRRRFATMRSVEVILDRRKAERRRGDRNLASRERRAKPRRTPLSREEGDWWQLAGFRIIARTDSFRLYETARR